MIQDIKDKKVKEREEKQKKLQELNPIKFEKQAIDYEKIINEQNQKIHTEKNNQPIFMDQHAVHAFNRISRFVYLK